jgi:hypothetical protein
MTTERSEQPSVVGQLRSLRYQAPTELYSLDGGFVGMGRKPLPEDERRQRRAATQKRYATGSGSEVKAKADERYHKSEKGRKTSRTASLRWYYQKKQQ